MGFYVFGFREVDRTKLSLVGGKGANLGELSKITGIRVPDGFCVSTEAFRRVVGETPTIQKLLDGLSRLAVEERERIGEVSGEIRRAIEAAAIPEEIAGKIAGVLARLGEEDAYAVRSSATAEDLPTASFAGQQDTYLNVIGTEAILDSVRKCWASLFTERAVIYRLQNGFDHRDVRLAVVVQKMVFPEAAGVLFTADPVTSNRKVVSIDASFGLGEAVVAGLVDADTYRVREGTIVDKKVSTKKLAIYALRKGGTEERAIAPAQQKRQVLTDGQILELARIGRRIEAHFGQPQDIEWCLADGVFSVVQSRPITTLFPIPKADDAGNHVYVSVGHQQMMTDAMKPLGLSMWQMTAARPMFEAGGRLFVDVTQQLASPASRGMLLAAMGQHDPLMHDALVSLIERGDFIPSQPEDGNAPSKIRGHRGLSSAEILAQTGDDPNLVADLIERSQRSIEELKQTIQTKSGVELFDFIREDIQRLTKSLMDPQSMGVILGAMNAATWLNERMQEWLGEKNVADTLSLSAPNNVTAEMGLALLDVADAIRPYPDAIAYLQRVQARQVPDDAFLDGLVHLEGGREARDAIRAYLDKYGMRGVGEIDVTRARWSEMPGALVPVILGHIQNFGPAESRRRFDQGRQEALRKEQELLGRLRQLPDGEEKADETKRMIGVLRDFVGYREYPKYGIIQRNFVYRQALLKEAEKLVQAKVLPEREDIYYLTFDELREVVRTHAVDAALIRKRKEEYRLYEKLTPPRVITSEGEIVAGAYRRENLPADALVGLAVSSGVVEGRARVVLRMEEAELAEGDILVTSFTDPSWTPLFVSIRGLVTEVGGLMTHGAVIAREYGIPAVVGVENATKAIRDGQRIRVHGTEGYVELL